MRLRVTRIDKAGHFTVSRKGVRMALDYPMTERSGLFICSSLPTNLITLLEYALKETRTDGQGRRLQFVVKAAL